MQIFLDYFINVKTQNYFSFLFSAFIRCFVETNDEDLAMPGVSFQIKDAVWGDISNMEKRGSLRRPQFKSGKSSSKNGGSSKDILLHFFVDLPFATVPYIDSISELIHRSIKN